jgi:hypothetical protein
MLGQDLSRLAILELDAWAGTPHGLSADKLHALGRKLRRRIVDGWPKWEERLHLWRQGLTRVGHSHRTADQFGALLAAADLALNNRLPHADNVDVFVEQHNLKYLAEHADDLPDYQRMLDWLLTTQTDVTRDGRKVNAAYLLALHQGRFDEIGLEQPMTSSDGRLTPDHAAIDAHRRAAARDLAAIGLKVVHERDLAARQDGTTDGPWWLAIANHHQGLTRLFETPTRSHWAGRSGAIGVWVQAARRVPGARWDNSGLRFGGTSIRATLVPLKHVLPEPPTQAANAIALNSPTHG